MTEIPIPPHCIEKATEAAWDSIADEGGDDHIPWAWLPEDMKNAARAETAVALSAVLTQVGWLHGNGRLESLDSTYDHREDRPVFSWIEP